MKNTLTVKNSKNEHQNSSYVITYWPDKIEKHIDVQNIKKIEKLRWLWFSVKKNIAKYTGAYLGPKDFAKRFSAVLSREHILRNK